MPQEKDNKPKSKENCNDASSLSQQPQLTKFNEEAQPQQQQDESRLGIVSLVLCLPKYSGFLYIELPALTFASF